MRRTSIFFLFISLMSFLSLGPIAYAGGLENVKSGARTANEKVQTVVDAALQPGTYEFAENLFSLVGKGIDFYFEQLVNAADIATLPQISNAVVSGVGKGLVDFKVDHYVNWGLDTYEDLAQKFWIQDFTQQVLQGSDVEIKPYFKGGFEFNSNVFREPEAPERQKEALWHWTPGVSANFPFGDEKQYRIGAVYEARFLEFTKYDQHDNVGQSLGVVGNFKLTDGLYVNVTEEMLQDASIAGTSTAKRVEYREQKVVPTVGYNWRDWTFEAEYENAHRRFDSDIYNMFEYDNNVITGRVYRTVASNVRLVGEYNFSHYDYDNDVTRVGRYHQGRVGVVGQLSDRTHLLARVGYMDRSYNQSSFSTQFDKVVSDIRLQHRLTSRTNLDFYFHRTAYESSYTSNRFFDEKRFQAQGNYLFSSKLRGRAGTAYIRRDYPALATTGAVAVRRRDIIGEAFIGLDYIFRPWLVMNFDYKYERSNSNNSNFDYTNNLVAVGMTMPL